MELKDIEVGNFYYVEFAYGVSVCEVLIKDDTRVGYKILSSGISSVDDGRRIIGLAPNPKKQKHWYLPWTWFY